MKKNLASFYGAGISTHLGFGVSNNIQALTQPAQAPKLHRCTQTGEVIEIPYKFLAEAPAIDNPGRLHTVLRQVIDDALEHANLSQAERKAMNIYIGSSSFDIAATEIAYRQDLQKIGHQALALQSPSFGNIADYLVAELAISGQDFSFNTACTASANALLTASTHIQQNLTRHALVIGIELYNNVSALGFHGLNLLTKSVMKPFDKNRDGLVLGEGISAIVLGPYTGQSGEFYLAGGANNCDTFGISSSDPTGSTITQVMQGALKQANVSTRQIDCIKAHGTASLLNDESEAAGMFALFDKLPPVCALKPHLGHTLGACGLNELILFYQAVSRNFLPATPGICAQPCDLNIQLNQQYSAQERGIFLLNYFGFGGNNTSLVIGNKQL